MSQTMVEPPFNNKIPLNMDGLTLFLMTGSLIGIYFGNAIGLVLFAVTSICAAFQLQVRYGGLWSAAKPYVTSPIVLIFLGLMASFLMSSARAIDSQDSFKTVGEHFIICLCGGIVALYIAAIPKQLMEFFLKILFLVTVIASGLMFAEMQAQKLFQWDFHKGGILNASRKIGTAFALLLPFMLTYAFHREKKYLWVAITFVVMVIFATGGRTGILAVLVAAIAFSFFFPWPLLKKWSQTAYAFWTSILAGGAIGTFIYAGMVGEEKFGYRVSGYDAATGSGRTDLWIYLLHKFSDHLFWGIGPKNFQTLGISTERISSYMHPHNMVIELLVETGVIGLGLVIILGAVLLTKFLAVLYKTNNHENGLYARTAQATLAALLTFLISAQFLTSIFHGWWVMYLVLLLGILGGMCLSIAKSEKEKALQLGHSVTATYPVAVSVIMPCHNGGQYLAEAIESVLAQSYASWELLVIDDGSSDHSYQVMQDYAAKDARIRVFQHMTSQGEGAARNTLIANAKGRYIAFLDCDDRWGPNKLAIQTSFMEQTGCPLSYGRYHVIDSNGQVIRDSGKPRWRVSLCHMFYTNDVGCPTAMYDSAIFGLQQMGNFKRNTDMLFWIQLLKQVRAGRGINQFLADYRVHQGGVSYNKKLMAKAHWETYRESLNVPLPFAIYYFGRYCVRGVLKTYFSRFI